jgi:GWxTD domain-containing protein
MSNSIKILLLLGLVFGAIQSASAQDIPATSQGDLLFYVDHAAFQGEEGMTYVEFYLMLHVDQLTPILKNETRIAVLGIQALINNEKDQTLSKNEWTTEAVLNKDSTDLPGLVIYDQWAEQIQSGNYTIKVNVHDVNHQENTGSINFDLSVPAISKQPFSASQIEFVSHAEQSQEKSHFVKSNRKVIPNPSRRYGILNPTLFLYYEIYHIPQSIKELMLNYSIRQTDGTPVRNFPEQQVAISGSNISLVHGFDVSTVPSGIYEFCVAIQNSNNSQVNKICRQFEVIQLDYFDSSPSLTDHQAEIASRLLKYLASPDEYQFYQDLNLKSKAQFLIRFWRDKDPTPGTKENEFLEQVQQRYLFANKNFSWAGIEGWNTDRGRILIQYGMPDDIDRHHLEAEYFPYEIWQYQQERNYIFIFGDIRADGRFILLHSTRENEIHNAQWKELLRRL